MRPDESVTSALVYLTIASTRNRLSRQLRQLRNPRYAAAVVFGAAYLIVVLGGQRRSAAPFSAGSALELPVALGLGAAVVWAWLFGAERRALAFSSAEVSFLFPAPLTRRELVGYKLFRSQLVVLLNTALWTVLLSGRGADAGTWRRMIAIWVLLSTLALHRLGAAFVRSALAEHGRVGLARRWPTLVAVAATAAAVVWSMAAAAPALSAGAASLTAIVAALDAAAARPLARLLLWPLRAAARPLTSPNASAWASAMGPAAALLALHCLWVLRSDTAFEETAAEVSMRRAEALARRRAGGAPTPVLRKLPTLLRLATSGHPARAILWKNLVAVLRTRSVTTLVLLVGLAAAATLFVTLRASAGVAQAVAALAGTWTIFLVAVGPQWVRNDLRADLRQLALLRTYPLSGASLVAAEVAASTVVLTLLQYTTLLVTWLVLLGDNAFGIGRGERAVLAAAALLLLPLLNYLSLLLHNGAALLFPAWVTIGRGPRGGVEALGQNLFTVVGFLLVLAVLLVPVAAGAAGTYAILGHGTHRAELAAAGIAAGGMAIESLLLVRWLGAVFERTDLEALGAVADSDS